MRDKQLVAIIIPIYKETLTYFETLSLKQCVKVLSKYPLIFVAPFNLSLKEYSQICFNYQVKRFDQRYFENIEGYNKLLLSNSFYQRFLNYKFILIYQLDAFVFKDELLYWCTRNYDFIGAPHYANRNLPGEMQFLKNYSIVLKRLGISHKVSNVGNGGFSLRKTRSFYLLLKLLKSKIKKWGNYNEDVFFTYWGNILYPFFTIPQEKLALKFSVETSPKESLEQLNNNLPFGCHAFEKHDFEIWRPFILKED